MNGQQLPSHDLNWGETTEDEMCLAVVYVTQSPSTGANPPACAPEKQAPSRKESSMAGFWKDFRDFAMRGNVLDLAIAVVLGTAFGKIVDSFVKDVLMPPIGLVLGRVDFSNLFVVLKDGAQPGPYSTLEAARAAGAVTIGYGLLLNNIISFLIIALSVFVVLRLVMRTMPKKPAAPAGPPEDVLLLRDIRDELRLRPVASPRGPDSTEPLAH